MPSLSSSALSSFEVVDLAWMRSPEYRAAFRAVDAAGGIYDHRWGDAPIRTLIALALLPWEQIHHFRIIGYSHYNFEVVEGSYPDSLPPRAVHPGYPEEAADVIALLATQTADPDKGGAMHPPSLVLPPPATKRAAVLTMTDSAGGLRRTTVLQPPLTGPDTVQSLKLLVATSLSLVVAAIVAGVAFVGFRLWKRLGGCCSLVPVRVAHRANSGRHGRKSFWKP